LNYGEVACKHQGNIIRDLATTQSAVSTAVDAIAEAVCLNCILSKWMCKKEAKDREDTVTRIRLVKGICSINSHQRQAIGGTLKNADKKT
jgi:hypothetical protein